MYFVAAAASYLSTSIIYHGEATSTMATTDKYDRQLRLWGAGGQRALAETTVILLRASAVGTETLKNLVLPGVGHIVVVDDNVPCTSSSSNFFTPQSSNAMPRAQVVLQHLQELNPDVLGEWKQVETMEEWTTTISSAGNTLVVVSDLEPPLLRSVAKECYERKLPLISVQGYGLIGTVRLQITPLPILDPKPENEPPNLRLVQPFATFQQLAQSIDWDKLDSAQHGHVPYPLILWRVSQEWKQSHGGELPRTFAEKEDFRKSIQAKSRNWDNEVNFHEALQNAYLAYTERELDLNHLATLKQQCDNGVAPKLFALLTALETFISIHHAPPLHGSIPDMTASTNLYVQLQKRYHDQAMQNVHEMKRLLGNDSNITEEEVHTFCRNVFNLNLLTTRTFEEEYAIIDDHNVLDEWNVVLMDPYEVEEQTPFLWYIALKACHLFYDTYSRYPGTIEKHLQDVTPLQECIRKVVADMKLQDNALIQKTLLSFENKYATEMARQANAEVHNIASVLGGVASQEAVKIITGQYVPLNNIYIYNGIASTGGVYIV